MSVAVTCNNNRSSSSCLPDHYTVVLVDSCRLFREGLSSILLRSCFTIVMEAANIQTVLGAQDRDLGNAFDLLIYSLDPDRSIANQLATLATVRRHDPNSKTVLLLPSCSVEDLVAAVLCGIEGVILNDLSGQRLISALELVMQDQHVLPGICKDIVARLRSAQAPELQTLDITLPDRRNDPRITANGRRVVDASTSKRNLGLSDREVQILRGLVEGCANKMIARRLNIAEATVKVHIKGLLRKLNLSNRTQAAIWAVNHSLLPETDEAAEVSA